ncbi:hypothetical protein HOE67_00885 [Candidatus Peregrinibacteria bacterium]|jgi:hypothetical protein|nr:hypothetical protein [Candidatus Peregrinibacteria bacterium]MBT4055643.1 hypothetical protein [Candidatus Peregrinibacteria bacterium]
MNPATTTVQFIDKDDSKLSEAERIQQEGTDVPYRAQPMFTISPCSPEDKYSENYTICDAVILIGQDRTSNQVLSVLTHQSPNANKAPNFHNQLESILSEFKDRTKPESREAFIAAGMAFINQGIISSETYIESIKTKVRAIQSKLGIEAKIIVGPAIFPSSISTALYLDTQNQILYASRLFPIKIEDETETNSKQTPASQAEESIETRATQIRSSKRLVIARFMIRCLSFLGITFPHVR